MVLDNQTFSMNIIHKWTDYTTLHFSTNLIWKSLKNIYQSAGIFWIVDRCLYNIKVNTPWSLDRIYPHFLIPVSVKIPVFRGRECSMTCMYNLIERLKHSRNIKVATTTKILYPSVWTTISELAKQWVSTLCL